jgi:hypothetical protein
MPITVVPTGPINNRGIPNQAQRSSAHDVIAMLDYTDLWLGLGTLHQDANVRVDQQPHGPNQRNIQVQINGIAGNSTIAHTVLSTTVQTNDQTNQVGVANKVISALNQSLDTAQSYSVAGSIP